MRGDKEEKVKDTDAEIKRERERGTNDNLILNQI